MANDSLELQNVPYLFFILYEISNRTVYKINKKGCGKKIIINLDMKTKNFHISIEKKSMFLSKTRSNI